MRALGLGLFAINAIFTCFKMKEYFVESFNEFEMSDTDNAFY